MTHIRLSVRRRDGLERTVLAAPGCTLSDVLRMAYPDSAPNASPWHVGDLPAALPALVGAPPLLDGALVREGPPAVPTPLEVVVVAGPGTGRRVPLAGGSLTLGRSPDCDLVVPDPRASRWHAVVEQARGEVSIRDLGATNGPDTGAVAPDARRPWSVGAEVRIGSASVVLRRRAPAPPGATTTGVVAHHPARTPPAAPPVVRLERPRPPREEELRSLNPVVLLAPMAVSAVAALVLRSPVLLMLGLTGPLVAILTIWTDRRRGRTSRRRAGAEYAAAVETTARELAAALETERAWRAEHTPVLSTALDQARHRPPDLWAEPAGTAVRWSPGRGTVGARFVQGADEEPPTLDDLPVEQVLPAGSTLAITGPRRRDLARSLVLQVVAAHGPDRVGVAVLADPRTHEQEWRWAGLLPHRRRELDDAGVLLAAPGPELRVVIDEQGLLPASVPGAVVVRLAPARATDLQIALDPVGDAGAVVVDPDGARTRVRCDLADAEVADGAARALAPVRLPGGAAGPGSLPASLALQDLLPGDADAVAQRWHATHRLGPTPVGAGVDGPLLVDLPADGPHALVAGTTGAGKSELLTTLVLALALTHPPDVVAVLLIDFKGGAAAAALRGLPHVCDVVTDLDPAGARRALVGLEAELKARERRLAALGATSIDEAPSLGRLVIVVDEFRVLAEEHPAFLAGLLRVAATGRSLGVHLALATQRPAGIVSADVRANVSLRIALRLNDVHDSQDVIDAPDAAAIPPSLPGRAVVRTADGALHPAQIAHAGAPPAAALPPVVVGATTARLSTGPDHLAVLVAACREAATRLGLPDAPSPVLAPLPSVVAGAELLAGDHDGLALGVVDVPAEQRQEVLAHDPERAGHLAVVGLPRSGRTTALRQLTCAAVAAGRDVLVIGPAPLADGLDPALVGSVVPPEHTRLVLRLLERARTEARPGTLVLVDGWSRATASTDPMTTLRLQDALVRLLGDGPGRGVHVAVSGDRTLLTGSLASHLTARLVLPLADATDLTLLGLPPALAAAWTVPGRALRAPDGAVVQVATPPTPAQAAALGGHLNGRGPIRLRPLPGEITLPAGAGAIGLGGDGAEPVTLPRTLRTLLVVGPDGSGRTTALRTIAQADGEPIVWVAPDGHGAPPGADVVDPLAGDAPAALAAAVEGRTSGVVVVDDLDDVADGPLDALLATLAEQRRVRLLVGSSPARVTGAYRGLAGIARRNRTGLVLGARTAADGEPLGTRLDAWDEPRPGRGVLVIGGRQTVLQVARLVPAPPDGDRPTPTADGGPTRPTRPADAPGVAPTSTDEGTMAP